VGRPDINPRTGLRIQPSRKRPPAREDETMLAVQVDYGQFQFAVIGRGDDGFPHCRIRIRDGQGRLDLDQGYRT
jgi:hypothetical protein